MEADDWMAAPRSSGAGKGHSGSGQEDALTCRHMGTTESKTGETVPSLCITVPLNYSGSKGQIFGISHNWLHTSLNKGTGRFLVGESGALPLIIPRHVT